MLPIETLTLQALAAHLELLNVQVNITVIQVMPAGFKSRSWNNVILTIWLSVVVI